MTSPLDRAAEMLHDVLCGCPPETWEGEPCEDGTAGGAEAFDVIKAAWNNAEAEAVMHAHQHLRTRWTQEAGYSEWCECGAALPSFDGSGRNRTLVAHQVAMLRAWLLGGEAS